METIPKYVIFTIPGTRLRILQSFRVREREPKLWWKSNSPFCSMLVDALEGNVLVREFHWKRWNSHQKRVEASQALQNALKFEIQRHPSAKFFCVAHSHGGNVLWMALKDQELSTRIDGAICLGTPFLQFANTGLYAKRGSFVFLIPSVLLLLLLYRHPRIDNLQQGLFMLFFALLAIFLGVGVEKLISIWRRHADKIVQRTIGCVHAEKFLLIRSTGDEAMGLLSGAYFLGWLPLRACNWITRLSLRRIANNPAPMTGKQTFKHLGKILLWVLLTISLVQIAATLIGLPDQSKHALGTISVLLLFVVFEAFRPIVLTTFSLIGSGLLGITLVLRSILLGFFIGPDLILNSLFLEVTAEPSPPGAWNIVQLKTALGAADFVDLEKSESPHQVYSHPEIVSIIAKWIRGKE